MKRKKKFTAKEHEERKEKKVSRKEKEKTWARCPCDTWTGRPCYEKEWIPAFAGMTRGRCPR